MSSRLVQYGFTAGIVSEDLWGQTILQKYGYGLADCKNFVINYTGTLISRPGTVGTAITDLAEGDPFRFVPFIFAEEDANTFGILFTGDKIRFLQQGYYQLEAGKAITLVTDETTSTKFACASHGYSVGDLLEFYGAGVPTQLVGQTVVVSEVVSSAVFRVTIVGQATGMDDWDDSSPSDVTAYRVYTLASPYDDDDLAGLYFSQARDQIKITSRSFHPRILERQSDGTWTLTEDDYDVSVSPPASVGFIASASGGAGCIYAVTTVSQTGEESAPIFKIVPSVVNITTTAGWIRLAWPDVAGAKHYNVYRTSFASAFANLSMAAMFGYVGQANGGHFLDENIIPDFANTFQFANNPFANSAIESVDVTASGSGYHYNYTITVTDSGSGTGALAAPIINENTGDMLAVLVLAGGQDYTSPIFTPSGGSGATFSATLTPASGNYPAISGLVGQRQVYASSDNYPMVVWGSQIGLFSNFNYSRIVAADESYLYEFNSLVVGEIKHVVETGAGMLAFSNLGVWLASGSQGSAVTPTDIQADRQTALGCSGLPPLAIDADILYMETNNRAARLMQYNDYSSRFGGLNVSVLATELFEVPYDLVWWAYSARPYSQVLATRNDGQILAGTVMSEQQVYAWGRYDTCGMFEYNITLPESQREVTYVVAARYLSGRWVRTIEYFADRPASRNEDHVGVDCAQPFGGTRPAASLTLSATQATASSSIFTVADEGKYIRYRNGKALIDTYNSGTSVDITIINAFTDIVVPYSVQTKAIPSGDWELVELMSSYQLPLNFRPAEVTVIGDGKVFTEQEVATYGIVTFEEDLAYGYIGLPFQCRAQALPLAADGTIIEDSRKVVLGVGLRYRNARGVYVGTEDDYLYPLERLPHTTSGESDRLQSGRQYTAISDDWDEDSKIIISVDGAFMAEISGLVADLDVGDEVS